MSRALAEHRVSDVLTATWPMLLDFDGPITHLFLEGRNRRVAEQMLTVLIKAGVRHPPEIQDTVDPLAVLRWSALNTAPATQHAVEAACISGEYQCVAESTPTTGARELLAACHHVGRPALIVSNNAAEPIKGFLKRHQLEHLVDAVVGRAPGHPELMKPHPDSIERALRLLDRQPAECAFVGDSVSDINVSHTTGVRSIGYAKNTRRGIELADAGADALINEIATLAELVRAAGQH